MACQSPWAAGRRSTRRVRRRHERARRRPTSSEPRHPYAHRDASHASKNCSFAITVTYCRRGAAGTSGPMRRADLDGTGRLVRLALRWDRIQLPIWLVTPTCCRWSRCRACWTLPDRGRARAFAVSSAKSPVALALNGLVSGDSAGAVLASQRPLLLSPSRPLMSTLLVVRHTRQEEETGRAEIAGGRRSPRHAHRRRCWLQRPTAAQRSTWWSSSGLAAGSRIGRARCRDRRRGHRLRGCRGGGRSGHGGGAYGEWHSGRRIRRRVPVRALGDIASTSTDGGVRVEPGCRRSWFFRSRRNRSARNDDDGMVGAGLASAGVHRHDWRRVRTVRPPWISPPACRPGPGPASASRGLLSLLGLAWRLQRGVFVGWARHADRASYGAIAQDVDELVGTSEGTADILAGARRRRCRSRRRLPRRC